MKKLNFEEGGIRCSNTIFSGGAEFRTSSFSEGFNDCIS